LFEGVGGVEHCYHVPAVIQIFLVNARCAGSTGIGPHLFVDAASLPVVFEFDVELGANRGPCHDVGQPVFRVPIVGPASVTRQVAVQIVIVGFGHRGHIDVSCNVGLARCDGDAGPLGLRCRGYLPSTKLAS